MTATSHPTTRESAAPTSNENEQATVGRPRGATEPTVGDDRGDSHPRSDSSSRRGLAAPFLQHALVEALPPLLNGCAESPPEDPHSMSLVGLLARGMQHNVPSTTSLRGSFATTTTTTPRPSATIGYHQETRGRGGRHGRRQSSTAGPGLQGRALGSRAAALRRSRDRHSILESGRRHELRLSEDRQRAALRAILDYALGIDGAGDAASEEQGDPL
jgi:hypothetical protein